MRGCGVVVGSGVVVVTIGVVVVVLSGRPRMRGMGSGCSHHSSHNKNRLTRLQWLTRLCTGALATCPECGAIGHGRLTAGTPLLAVARQIEIANVIPHPRTRHAPTPHARVHVLPATALAVGHLVRVHVPGFTKPDPQTRSQPRLMLRWHQCAKTCRQLGEIAPAMNEDVCEWRWEWRE